MKGEKLLLVGDNPFIGVSHLSQERAIARGNKLDDPEYCAELVKSALQNRADGFMFTMSEKTLSILKIVSKGSKYDRLELYAIVPYVPEFVRVAATAGGIPGLAKKIGRQIVFSGNSGAAMNAIKGVIGNDPASLLKSYLSYEISRLKSAKRTQGRLASIMLHEVVTDMALALDMRWLCETYNKFMLRCGIKPGYETRNFAYLVKKFEEWELDFGKLAIASPFNTIGFQMCPSRDACVKALERHPEAEVIGFSILASGYIKLQEAVEYIEKSSGLNGVAIGVSNEKHARETFRQIKEKFRK